MLTFVNQNMRLALIIVFSQTKFYRNDLAAILVLVPHCHTSSGAS